MQTNNHTVVRILVGTALFAALAYAVTLVLRIPVQFLTFDAKDAVLTVAGFIYGPLSSVLAAFIVSLIEMLTISGTGPWGFLMNFLSSAIFAGVASLLYHLHRSVRGALASLGTAIAVTTGAMLLLNLWITPLYLGVPVEGVKSLLLPLLLPFNFAKACLNASIAMLLYKPTVTAMRRAGMVPTHRTTTQAEATARGRGWLNRASVWFLSIALVLAAVAVTLFLLLRA